LSFRSCKSYPKHTQIVYTNCTYHPTEAYDGGAIYQRKNAGKPEGWVANHLNPQVQARFARLLEALGSTLDGKIEGINVQESAIGVYQGVLSQAKSVRARLRRCSHPSHVYDGQFSYTMHKTSKFYFALFIPLLIVFLGYQSVPEPVPLPDERLVIQLRWCKAYPTETWKNVEKGLAWTFSFLGADLPKGSLPLVLRRTEDPTILEVHLEKAGFNATGQVALATILDSLKRTPEYERYCSIDLGRFVVLVVHSSFHYYQITGLPRTLASFRSLHQMNRESTQCFPLVRSSVTAGNRDIVFKTGASPLDWGFIAAVGHGRMEYGNFMPTEYEVFDIMPNGQPRFGIYDQYGNLEAGTPAYLSDAGKPGNCMWCHESSVQLLFSPTIDVPGKLTSQAFIDTVLYLKDALLQFQRNLNSEIEFDSLNAHTQHELLYISFMEPSLGRIAQEWGKTMAETQRLLRYAPTHQNTEHPWMPPSYSRRDVDALAPVRATPIPSHVRETSVFEPDFFGQKSRE